MMSFICYLSYRIKKPYYICVFFQFGGDDLALEKTLTLYNVIIHINIVLNKDQNHYYYNIFLEQCSHQSAKK